MPGLSPIVLRRHHELRARVGSLETEFQHWRQQTRAGPLARHQSQVQRLTHQLSGLLDPVKEEVACPPADTFLRQARRLETAILAAHTLWEFFRSKLVLRESSLFRDHLAACDDLAWACYKPLQDALGGGRRREPPLVYLNALWSPFAMPRGRNFADEIRSAQGLGTHLSADRFQTALDALPIPLVGLPWYHTAHLPGGLLLAHEVGHVADWDFGLDPAIEAAFQSASGIPPDRQDAWLSWRHEIFADAFAICAVGPAFVGTLIDLLAAPASELLGESGLGRVHPPRLLRIALVLEFLRRLGRSAEAQRLETEWQTLVAAPDGSTAVSADYLPDVPAITTSLLATAFEGHPLTTLLAPSGTDIPKLALRLVGGFPVTGLLDPRDAFTAARWIQENRSPAELQAASDLIRNHLRLENPDPVRGPHGSRPVDLERSPDPGLAALDREAGRKLLEVLLGTSWNATP